MMVALSTAATVMQGIGVTELPAGSCVDEVVLYQNDRKRRYTGPMNAKLDHEFAAHDRVRGCWAAVLNVLVPGSGLIVLRQDRLGGMLSFVFAVGALLGLWGLWIVPGSIPLPVAIAGGAGAVVMWVASQWLVWRRMSRVLGDTARRHLERCCELAADAMANRRLNVAGAYLREALLLNDEVTHVRVQWARLLVALGRFPDARAAWEAVLDLDEEGSFHREAVAVLDRLPEEGTES